MNISHFARLIFTADVVWLQFFQIALLMDLQISRNVEAITINSDGEVDEFVKLLRWFESISDSTAM